MRRISQFLVILLPFLCARLCAQELPSFVDSPLAQAMGEGDKAALLMVHFGTTFDDTRARTIDAVNEKARTTFPQLEVRECYTSRIILRRLDKKGVHKLTPIEAMMQLRAEGYTHLIVQSTNVIDGMEMESLHRDVERMESFFKEVRVGKPLLYSVDDALKVVDILAERHPANAKKHEHVLFIGHGTETPATALYSELDYMFRDNGHDNCHVGTIEGYPTFDTALRKLKLAKAKKVTLVPLMFVAGDHAANDISKEWKEQLEKEGFKVELLIEGLGEVPEIQDIYIDHIGFLLNHRLRPVMEKKNIYSHQKD